MPIKHRLEKIAAARTDQEKYDRAVRGATIGGAVPFVGSGIPAAIAAPEGEKLKALGGGMAGNLLGGSAGGIAGGMLGAAGGALASKALGLKGLYAQDALALGTGLGGLGGAMAGSSLAGRKGVQMALDDYAREKGLKTASVSELSAYADLVEQGHFGKEAQYAFQGMTEAIESYVEEDLAEKTASSLETDYNIYDENAARIARLDTLLRKL